MRFMSQNELTHKMTNLRDENKTGWTKQYIPQKDKIWLILGQMDHIWTQSRPQETTRVRFHPQRVTPSKATKREIRERCTRLDKMPLFCTELPSDHPQRPTRGCSQVEGR